jgi:catechol 2,3-dioxygenase-like lactoylglutathione lyase family enzyme
MTVIRRLDHPIVCVRDLKQWVPLFDRVLDLRPERSRQGDEWGFSNAELSIGDGFLGVVEPAGEGSQLERFLDRYGEGFYGLSVDVGDLDSMASFLDERDVRYRDALRDGERTLLWLPPAETNGVVYQLTSGVAPSAGTNPNYLGVSEVLIAVRDLDQAVDSYCRVFGFDVVTDASSDALAYSGARLGIPGSALEDALVLAEPTTSHGPIARHLESVGEGMFQFTIAVEHLESETARLNEVGVGVTIDSSDPTNAVIDPNALRGLRIALREHTTSAS